MSNIYWVGVRESDLLAADGLYSGSITFFGSGEGGNRCLFQGETARKDHNQKDSLFDSFYTQSMQLILQEDSDARFMFYNQDMIGQTDPSLWGHILCPNPQELLRTINNKMLCKLWLKGLVPLLPGIQMFGSEISRTKIEKYLPNTLAFVIQPAFSSGGHNTYLLMEKNESSVLEKLSSTALYTVSPYKETAIPVNIHGLAYRDGFQLYPASIQLIRQRQDQLLYEGGDFLAFQTLPDGIRNRLYCAAEQVSEKLVSAGYLGIYGIDLIVAEDEVYFMEINPRFQASTPVLYSWAAKCTAYTAQNRSRQLSDGTITLTCGSFTGADELWSVPETAGEISIDYTMTVGQGRAGLVLVGPDGRSEERRVGKECGS